MEACAGVCEFESTCAACLGGAPGPGMHGLHARSAIEARALSESVSLVDLSQRTVMPYAERGWICVSGSHVCVYARCSGCWIRSNSCT